MDLLPRISYPTACFHGAQGPCWGDGAPEACSQGACALLSWPYTHMGAEDMGDFPCPVLKGLGHAHCFSRLEHSWRTVAAAQTWGHPAPDPGGALGPSIRPSSQGCGERGPSHLRKADQLLESGGTGSLCTSSDWSVNSQGFTEVSPTRPPLLVVSVSVQEISQRRVRGIFQNMVNAEHLHFYLPHCGSLCVWESDVLTPPA